MKKIFTLLSLVLMIGVTAQAQTKFTMTIVSPAVSSNQTQGVAFAQEAYVTIDQGSVSPTDTFAWIDPLTPANNVNFKFVSATKNTGDTIRIDRAGVVITNSGSTLNYCVAAFVFSGGTFAPTFDTTGGTWSTCNLVNVAFATGVGDVKIEQVGQTKKLNIYPNPAVGNKLKVDFVAQNTSVVEAKVYDLTGRTVLSHTFGNAYKGQEGYGLDISAINKGMYILELRQDGVKATGQFVK